MRKYLPIFVLAALFNACGLETEPNPDYQSASGGSGGSGGHSGNDAGDAGGEGGTSGGGTSGGNGGTTGGSSGQGGDSSTVDCDDNSGCSATLPQCSPQGSCISCTSSAACEDRGALAFCETKLGSDHRGQCVACIKDADCEGNDDGEYCNNNTCVPCKTHADCTDSSKPECAVDGQCIGCNSNDACVGRDGPQVCLTAAGPKRGNCVACVGDYDCGSLDAPQCKPDNTCGPCTSDDACDGRNGTERCNLREDAETFGACVECTGATEADDCDGKSCKQSTGECTEIEVGDLNPCERCEADSQCGAGTKCVAHILDDATLGSFCFLTATAAGCASDTNPGIKPYSKTVADTLSVDSTESGQQATYCLPRTSCLAIEHADTAVECGTSNAACGVEDVDDGVCLQSGAASGKCSYSCVSAYDCLSGLGADVLDTCSGPEGGKTCQPD